MNEGYNLPDVPQEGTQEHDEYMRSQFGDDYELGYRVGFGRRLGAFIIDVVLAYIIVTIINSFFFDEKALESIIENQENLDLVIPYLKDILSIMFIVTLLYYISEVFFGFSLGKLILKIRIAAENRSEANTSNLLIRYLIKYSFPILAIIAILLESVLITYLSVLGLVIFIIGSLVSLGSTRQALHDKISKTAVYFKENIKNY
ncbi:MAG: RDD family protein [Candidatus Kapaibacterium sp.]|nr:RDD family protein [Ignavibacteriota bacterium]MCB9220834.1 RDD family protein [Ignavibacteria bacterium]